MKLPGGENSVISKQKLEDYILSEIHTVGKLKARYFRSAGFNHTNIALFKELLLKISTEEEVTKVVPSSYGKKYIIDAKVTTPKGKVIRIRTIWIIENNQKTPRFVTVYPV